jgi:MoaD family protein
VHRRFAKKSGEVRVTVQFYGQLRDLVRVQSVDVDLVDNATVSDLLEHLYQKFPILRAHDQSILVGADVEFVDRNYKIKTGDEISIMPPVQGG